MVNMEFLLVDPVGDFLVAGIEIEYIVVVGAVCVQQIANGGAEIGGHKHQRCRK